MSKVAADNKLPDISVNRTVYPKIAKQFLSPRHLLIQVCQCLQGYLVIFFWSDMTCTLVSSSPPLKILPLEYMAVLEPNWNQLVKCVVCEEWGENLHLSLTQIQVFSECLTFPFNHTCLIMHVSNFMIIVNVSNYDHVEQFISSSAMSKSCGW